MELRAFAICRICYEVYPAAERCAECASAETEPPKARAERDGRSTANELEAASGLPAG